MDLKGAQLWSQGIFFFFLGLPLMLASFLPTIFFHPDVQATEIGLWGDLRSSTNSIGCV